VADDRRPAADEGPPGALPASGPLPLPPGYRSRDPRWAWAVSLAVVALALALYVFTRPPTLGAEQGAPQPTWGALTLAHVAQSAATAAGEAHPRNAVWLFAARGAALGALTGTATQDAEAEYVVMMIGQFQLDPSAALAGTSTRGSRLVVLVRAFDGTVTGEMATDADLTPALSRVGSFHPLRFSLFG
jgi:hypothetical protein